MDLDLTRIFVKVVQLTSFSKAAQLLGLPKSTVSKAVSRLESMTGTTLLVRTTRSLTLTAAGRAFYETCLGPIQQIEDAMKSLDGSDSLLTGKIRLTAPEDLGSQVIAPSIARLTQKHPGLSFELHYTDEIVDLVRDGFDLAVRIGPLRESRLKAKKLGEIHLIAVASETYLKSHPKIRTPQDLEQHDCLSINAVSESAKWYLKSKKESAQLNVRPRIVSNQMTSLLKMAGAGAGVALVPSYLCIREMESGELLRVLPGWRSPGFNVSLISPLASTSSARLKMASDQIGSAVAATLSRMRE